MNTYKKKLFLDFDSTIANSILSFTEFYNLVFKNEKNFKKAIADNCNQWDLKDICPLVNNPMDVFSSKLFFEQLTFMDNAKEVLLKLSEQYELIICSIGTYDNISLKSLWIEKHLPFIKNSILIVNEGCKMNKSMVDMNIDNSIFIDDHESNLYSSNCDFKICFGKEYPWNSKWIAEGNKHCIDWLEVEKMLLP